MMKHSPRLYPSVRWPVTYSPNRLSNHTSASVLPPSSERCVKAFLGSQQIQKAHRSCTGAHSALRLGLLHLRHNCTVCSVFTCLRKHWDACHWNKNGFIGASSQPTISISHNPRPFFVCCSLIFGFFQAGKWKHRYVEYAVTSDTWASTWMTD